jgi:hypothetical protein
VNAVSLEIIFLVNSLNMQNCSGTSVNVGLTSSAGISLLMGCDFVRHVEHKSRFSSLAIKHDTVFEPNATILAKSVWHLLQTLSKLLLCVVDDKLSCLLLPHVLLELDFVHLPVLSPVSNSGLVVKSGSS